MNKITMAIVIMINIMGKTKIIYPASKGIPVPPNKSALFC